MANTIGQMAALERLAGAFSALQDMDATVRRYAEHYDELFGRDVGIVSLPALASTRAIVLRSSARLLMSGSADAYRALDDGVVVGPGGVPVARCASAVEAVRLARTLNERARTDDGDE